MLDEDEAINSAQKFGVAESQVRRDHVISHGSRHLWQMMLSSSGIRP